MKSALKSQAPRCALVNKPIPNTPPDPPKLSDRYILVCSQMFDCMLSTQGTFSCIEITELREEHHRYAKLKEDQWNEYGEFNAKAQESLKIIKA